MDNYDFLEVIEDRKPEQEKALLWTAVILLLLLLIVGVNLRFKNIEVLGNRRLSDEEVTGMLLPGRWDYNPFYALYRHKLKKHGEYSFISSYQLNLTGINSCEIIVYEKEPLGCVDYMGSFMYFDSEGIIIESVSERKEDIPEITGLKFGEIVFGKKLDTGNSKLYDEIMNITSQLYVFNIPCSRIHFNEMREATLYICGGKVRVMLGNDSYLSSKLSVLNDVYSEIKERDLSGTADLSGYNDRDSEGFSFIPD